ncbi:odorant receptor 63a-like [Anopheles bellator]|uniref:odorant receptor 63a-like n=1 Tax=Anopheles bellator TaxID=139047 RepID=UPI0026480EEA|nr:odorant receptor 63a-like [Anopheles bellator]
MIVWLMLIFYPVAAGLVKEQVLPVGCSIPFFDYTQHPWYIINYIMNAALIVLIALMFAGLDGPFYLFVCHSAAQLEILILYASRIGENPDNPDEQRRIVRKMFDIHTRMSDFSSKCSRIFQDIFLSQTICSTIHICVSLFHVQFNSKSNSFGMALTNVCKMWLFCYGGEFIKTKANAFNNALYASRWYRQWVRRDLADILFMMANAQRNYGFSVGGFRYLSYETFTEIMKTAYTCNAFLQQVFK